MCDFDNWTGVASNLINLSFPPNLNPGVNPYGIEFSPDGTKLYGTSPRYLFQWNLCAGNPTAVATPVYSVNTLQWVQSSIWGLQLATDGKIYIARNSQTDLAVINNPNNAGPACNFTISAGITFTGGSCALNLPNFITSNFSTLPSFTYSLNNIYGCNTASFNASALQQYQQNVCSASGYTGLVWDFGDPISGSANTSTISNPLHTFSSIGTYTVKLIMYSSNPCGGGNDTVSQVINANLLCMSFATQSITCSSLGSATVSVQNGIGPFSYTWMPGGQISSVVTGLNPDTYTLYALDAGSGSTYSNTTTFTSLVPYTGTVINSPIQSCATTNTSVANILLSGGSGTQTYVWSGPSGVQTNSTLNGLGAGDYTVTVTDALTSCLVTQTFSILLAPYTATINNSAYQPCFGTNTGTAVVVLSGGSGSQNYFWSGPTGVQTNSIAIGLSAGVYSAVVTDAVSSCSVMQTFTLGPPPAALGMVLYSGVPVVCSGSSVSLLALGYGGTYLLPTGYTYSWTNGPSTDVYNAVPFVGGNIIYTVTITDSNACTFISTISVSVTPNPLLVVPNVSICPQQTGTLNVSGANTYTWSTGVNTTSISASPLTTTAYTVTGTALGCTSVATPSIILNAIPIPTITSNSPVCSTKTLNLYGNGANTYTWSGPGFFNSFSQNPQINSATLNNSGLYNVTVTAANSCTASASINVTVYPTPTLSTTGATVCVTQTVNLLANAVGAITYTWSGPVNFNSNLTNPVIANPSPSISGIYTLNVSSTEGCTNTAQVNVTVSALPQATFTSNSPKCEGSTLSFNSSASIGGSVYNWTGPNGFNSANANPSIANLSPNANGIYTLTLIEGPCSSTVSQNIIVFTNPIPVVNHNAPLCETKTFSASVNNVYPAYQWSGPSAFTGTNQTIVIVNTSTTQAGIYTVEVTDVNTCKGQATASIVVMLKPILNVAGADVCYREAALISASGANTYSWSGPGGFTAFTSQAIIPSATNVVADTYYVIGQGINTCTSLTTVQVTTKGLPIAGATLTPRACINSAIYFEGEGGLLYSWNGPLGFTSSLQNFTTAASNIAMAGPYTLMVTDQQGCKDYKTVNLLLDPLPRVNLVRSNTQSCIPFCSDFKFEPLASPLVTSSWQMNGQNVSGESFNYCFTGAGNYTLQGNFEDTRSCKNSVSFVINAYPLPQADFSYFPQQPIEGDEIRFESTSSGTELQNYNWYFIKSTLPDQNTRTINHSFADAGAYAITLQIKNKWGCEDTATKTINVIEDFSIYVPNAFTPNDDNTNQYFKAVSRGVKTFNIMIHNRWGQLVYQSNELSPGWDGSFKGQPCKEDVYTWQIEATSIKGKEEKLSGSVLLYR